MGNPITINITSVTKDSPGAGQITIVGTYDTATAYSQPSQRVTVGNYPNNKFSRGIQLTSDALFCIRNGASNIVALAVSAFTKIAVALDPTLSYPPVFTTDVVHASCVFSNAALTGDNVNVANNDTVTVGVKTYTFKTALTPAEGEVLIGASADASLLNLISAINHTGTPGTNYQCAAANTQVWAEAAVAAHVMTIHSLAIGTASNSIGTTKTSSHLTWGGTTMANGTAAAAFGPIVVDSELAGTTYQWQYSQDGITWTNCSGTPVNGTTYSNYTTATLTCTPAATGVASPGTGQSGYWHRCQATNSRGTTNSAKAQLTIT